MSRKILTSKEGRIVSVDIENVRMVDIVWPSWWHPFPPYKPSVSILCEGDELKRFNVETNHPESLVEDIQRALQEYEEKDEEVEE